MLTLTSMMERTRLLFGSRPAIIDPDGIWTWAQWADRVARAATVLYSLGVRPGDRYAVVCRNSHANAELMHAGYWMGAIPVPVNFRLAPPEIAYILDNAECGLLVLEQEFASILEAEELGPWAENVLLVGVPSDTVRPRYEPLLADIEPLPLFDDAHEEDEALLVYTGGTAGRAKGVPLSHRNIVANAMQIALTVSPRPDDVFLHVAPMFHSADLLAIPYTTAGGAHLYLPKFTSETVFRAIGEYGVTSCMLTPTMIVVMLQDPDISKYEISSLRQVIYGSSPMAAEWITRALERFPAVDFIQAYGLTETSPLLTMLSMAEHRIALATGDRELLTSVGQPLVGVDLRLLDDDGQEAEPGEAGEVVVRGPNVAAGYLKRPEATAAAFREGWFYTGDVGRLDDEGRLFLLDRKKDMIITGGENVYSLEVEAVLHQHPNVIECAVVGVPDEVYGEALLAAIVPTPGKAIAETELIEHCRNKIGGYKIPRRYVFLDELPKSAMNKILKNELRRVYGDGNKKRAGDAGH